ncbi:MAG: Gfo/Idh/MocA family oxidoreductase [Acidobacteria bacterium]|nr:Gfo/Idh/MocA family oxidoreductase [Acidobacteriota bacterium]
MPQKEHRLLRVGVLGCGAIAQAAHFESCVKARNAELHAICDVASDLLERMKWIHQPRRTYSRYAEMLADSELEAVIIATADQFHVPAALAALQAGKHVLCEKPLGVSVEEVEELRKAVLASGLVLQVGHMKRFDAGLEAARDFIAGEMGEMLALKAWYCDSTHRYPMTDAVQPVIVTSPSARKPSGDPKANRRAYYMLAHGSHLVDTARFLGGEIVEIQARTLERFGAYCWFAGASFASGALGHLDLTVAVRMDWHEGLQVYGEHGSLLARTYNPWYYKTSEVDIFREATGATTRVLGADGHFYRRQLEGFADTVLHGAPMRGANIEDGIACVRAMVALEQSARTGRPVKLAAVSGGLE